LFLAQGGGREAAGAQRTAKTDSDTDVFYEALHLVPSPFRISCIIEYGRVKGLALYAPGRVYFPDGHLDAVLERFAKAGLGTREGQVYTDRNSTRG
jgi:hypothetical protein